MKGLSEGLVQIIILTAAVIITLVVVGFAFGLLGGISSVNEAYQVYSAYIYQNKNYYILNVSISANLPTEITSACIINPHVVNGSVSIKLATGIHSYEIWFNKNGVNLVQGEEYNVEITLANGKSLVTSSEYIGNS